MNFLIELTLFIMQISISCQYSISETRHLNTLCRGPQGIVCDCQLTLLPLDVQDIVITINSCSRKGGWSNWSNWSICHKNRQKRRRICTRPTPIGQNSSCIGSRAESRFCVGDSSIPEFIWGSWSPWNKWSDCNCRSLSKLRTRFCIGKSCEGCSLEYSFCNLSCPEARIYSDWTNWLLDGNIEQRFRCLSTTNSRNISSKIIKDSRESRTNKPDWTEWEIRRGVALRYQNTTVCRVQTHPLALTAASYRVHTFWLVFCCTISLFLGFVAQSCVSHCFIKVFDAKINKF